MQGQKVQHLTFRPAADGSLHVLASPSAEQPGSTHTVSARDVQPQQAMWVRLSPSICNNQCSRHRCFWKVPHVSEDKSHEHFLPCE